MRILRALILVCGICSLPAAGYAQSDALLRAVNRKSLTPTGFFEADIRKLLQSSRPQAMQNLLKVEKLLSRKFGPTQLIIRGLPSGDQPLSAAVSIEQLGYLKRMKPAVGGLRDDDKVLLSLACESVYQRQLPPQRASRGPLIETRSYNLIGVPLQVTRQVISAQGALPPSSTTRPKVIPWLDSDGKLTILARYDFVEPAVVQAATARNRKNRKLLEEHDLLNQLKFAANQVLVLNSEIKNGALEPTKPGLVLTPMRYLILRVDQQGKVQAKLDIPDSSDRQKLRDAHENAGEFKDVKGVPVGEVLP